MMNYPPITHREALRNGVKPYIYFLNGYRSPVLRRENPPIDSLTLIEWSSFDEDISRYLGIPELQRTYGGYCELFDEESESEMTNKNEIQSYSFDTCMALVIDSFQEIGYDVNALIPTRTSVVGKPDLVVTAREFLPKPRAVIEYRVPSTAMMSITTGEDLERLIATNSYYGTLNYLSLDQQELHDNLHKIAGYIEMNHLQHGVLSTHNVSFFLRRTGPAGKLEVSRAVLPTDPERVNFPEAMHWLVFECIVKENWLYSYLNGSQMTMHLTSTLEGLDFPPNDPHKLLKLSSTKFHQIFELSKPLYNSKRCTVFEGYMKIDSTHLDACEPKKVAVKIVDHKDLISLYKIMREVENYERLKALQGTVLLRVLAYLRFCNLIDVLVLHDIGERVMDWNDALRCEAANLLENLHETGFLHGEVKRRNFIQTVEGLCIVNLGNATLGVRNITRQAEMRKVSRFV